MEVARGTLDGEPLQLQGGCCCGEVRYRLLSGPLIVHACHCRRCQRQTGAAYVVNALIEADRVVLETGSVHDTRAETPSGSGQSITRCSTCQVAVWSRYHALPKVGDHICFVRVGTLDEPNACPPGVHIHTASKQAHVLLPEDVPVCEDYYRVSEVWSSESRERYATLVESVAAARS